MGDTVRIFMTIEQLYLLIFVVLYFGLILGVRTLILYWRTGINPSQKFGRKSEHHFAERLIPMAVILLLIIAGNYFFLTENIEYLLPFRVLDLLWLKHLGLVCSIIGLITTFIAKLQMKDSWRIGLDHKSEIELVDKGIIAYSRNPIYVALMTAHSGVFFIVPGLASLVFVIIMTVAIHIKVKDEEKFLEQKLGDLYVQYRHRVRRWI